MKKTRKTEKEIMEGYYVLTETLKHVGWALEGSCNDIDCDRYLYKNLLKSKYKPVLEHSFSCLPKLKREKEALLRLLSMRKFSKFRYVKCKVCKRATDKLSEKCLVVGFTRPLKRRKGYTRWDGYWVHKKCEKKVKIPEGWKKGF